MFRAVLFVTSVLLAVATGVCNALVCRQADGAVPDTSTIDNLHGNRIYMMYSIHYTTVSPFVTHTRPFVYINADVHKFNDSIYYNNLSVLFCSYDVPSNKH